MQNEECTYLAGLWRSQLPVTLLWYHDLPCDTNASKPKKYRAPSWSWASLDCRYLDWLCDRQNSFLVSEVLDAHVTLTGANSFGQVSAGYVELMAPLKKGWLRPTPHYPEFFDVWADDGQMEFQKGTLRTEGSALGRVYFDLMPSAHIGRELGPAYLIRITEKAGLLLAPLGEDEHNCRWTRLGAVAFDESSFSWWEDCEKRLVTIL
jgi:hypothetical protein